MKHGTALSMTPIFCMNFVVAQKADLLDYLVVLIWRKWYGWTGR